MSDVLQSAQNYQRKLKVEIAKVEEFLRFGEEMSKGSDLEAPLALTNPAADATPPEDRAAQPLSAPVYEAQEPPRRSPEPTEEPPRRVVDEAEDKKPEAAAEPEKAERKSLFRGASKAGDSDRMADRIKGVA